MAQTSCQFAGVASALFVVRRLVRIAWKSIAYLWQTTEGASHDLDDGSVLRLAESQAHTFVGTVGTAVSEAWDMKELIVVVIIPAVLLIALGLAMWGLHRKGRK